MMLIYKHAPTNLDQFELTEDMRIFMRMIIKSGSLNIMLVGERKTSLINAIVCEYYNLNDTLLVLPLKNMMISKNVMYVNNITEHGVAFYRNSVKAFCQSYFTAAPHGIKKTVVLDNLDCVKNIFIQEICYNLIETYSDRVNFIVSGTNLKKIIENIQSHCLIISTPILTSEQSLRILRDIIAKEQIQMQQEEELQVLDYIIMVGNNNVNVMINFLETFKLLNEPISFNIAKVICTNINFSIFNQYMDAVTHQKLSDAMEIMAGLIDLGYSVIDVLETFFAYVKTRQCDLTDDVKYLIIPIICEYIVYFNTIQENTTDLFFFTNKLICKLSYHDKSNLIDN